MAKLFVFILLVLGSLVSVGFLANQLPSMTHPAFTAWGYSPTWVMILTAALLLFSAKIATSVK